MLLTLQKVVMQLVLSSVVPPEWIVAQLQPYFGVCRADFVFFHVRAWNLARVAELKEQERY